MVTASENIAPNSNNYQSCFTGNRDLIHKIICIAAALFVTIGTIAFLAYFPPILLSSYYVVPYTPLMYYPFIF